MSAPDPTDEANLQYNHRDPAAFNLPFPLLLMLAIAFATLCGLGGLYFGDDILRNYGGQYYDVTPISPDGLPPPPTVDDRRPAQPTLSPRPPLSPSAHGTGARPGQHAAPGH